MSKYDVLIYNIEDFKEIEANSEEEARHIALERWLQCIPPIRVYRSKTDSDVEDEDEE